MIQLGQECRDKVSGCKGIVIAKTEWLNGCIRFTLQPKMGKDGKVPDGVTFDEPQLEIIGPGICVKSTNTGGPIPEPNRNRDPK